MSGHDETLTQVAVVGLAGRFPGAADAGQLWDNLRRGVDSISRFTPEELDRAGVSRALRERPGFMAARGVLRDADLFDAPFFGFSPREARLLDPQQRVFLECAWEALEDAGCDPGRMDGAVGVYAGASQSTYFLHNLASNPEVAATVSGLEVKLANDRDFLAPLVSYRLNLRGPSVNVATACSTSLVAVHLACQGLLNRECDVALAGGVSVSFPQVSGYVYQEGGILSADGRCRAFDAAATGSLGGDGAGIVVLKRLEDALRDGDAIRAVIRGSAINNDGSLKIGFTAPSVDGQAAVIAEAQALAGVDPATVTYLEAHGSGTPLGDPVEIRALTRAFRTGTQDRGFCAVGSVKTNVGHLDAAAGITGLIKTVLALENRLIPPSLHFSEPNPEIPFTETPFRVAAKLADWNPPEGVPRRAGVNSFGMGGTNAHVVLEEAPATAPSESSDSSRPWQLLVLSAAAPVALESATDRLALHLKAHPEQELADVAFTLQAGRKALRHRRMLVCRDRADAIGALAGRDPRRLLTGGQSLDGRPVAFLFPGVGDHYPGMAKGLYETEAVFRKEIDRGAEILRPLIGTDPRRFLLAEEGGKAAAPDLRRMLGQSEASELDRTLYAQTTVFLVEMALVRLWRSRGVRPALMLGYSLGEYAAACAAGVFSFEDGLRIVAERARLIEELPAGAMLAVPLAEADLAPSDLSLAAVNAPGLCVLSGAPEAVEALEVQLAARGVSCRRLPTTHAFHSRGMEPIAERFAAFLGTVALKPPQRPYVTAVTGDRVTPEEATDPAHWVRHLLGTVRFADGLRTLGAEPSLALLEVGPGHGLTTLALQQGAGGPDRVAVPSMRPAYDGTPDDAFLLGAAGKLWLSGVDVDWAGVHAGERRRKVALPAYPFQRQRYWVEPGAELAAAPATIEAPVHGRPGLRTEYAPPRNPEEETLAGIWEEILGLRPVGIHDSFFELGGHSLLAPRVLRRVREAFGVDVPLARLLAEPTVAELAVAVRAPETAVEAPPDLSAEAILDPAIQGVGETADPAPSEVFLTGATGFLGAWLLRDLLAEGVTVHCLVRAADAEEGRRRILGNLEEHRLDVSGREEKIVAVPGDLAEPRWGLGEDGFRLLAERVGAIYHAGAWVNFTYPYRVLAPANVRGTEEALRLAATGRPKTVHFVSSLSAFAPGSFTADGLGLEASDLPVSEGLGGGYPQTKWVSEQLIRQARERGIPAVVYRPGLISGDTASGVNNPRDLMWSFLKSCLQMEAAPDLALAFDPVPVDFVSRAIVHLSRRPESASRAFHFFNPRPVPWREVFVFARSLGYPLELLPVAEWDRRLAEAVRSSDDNALSPFFPLFSGRLGSEAAPEAAGPGLRFDAREAEAALAGTVECPPIEPALLRLYFEAFARDGFLPAPREREMVTR
ncbi:MAG: thioester reductase domain-containing protein [Acidobacteriota bacterium]